MNLKPVFTENTLTFQNDEKEILAVLSYSIQDDVLIIMRIEVSEILRGQGIAGKLTEEFYNYAKKNNKKIQPVCSYAVAWFKKHTDKNDVLANLKSNFKCDC